MIRDPKQKILISFSGGETSGYMINWLLKHKPNYDYKFVFANTGEENEETLLFVKQVTEFFKIDVAWVEYEELSFKVVNYDTAYRSNDPQEIKNKWPNHPFRKYISKFGIPNRQNFACTRELKQRTINRYMRSQGWKASHYDTAIGIRADEIDRVGEHYYPLVIPHITKPLVNAFWDKMPFRLQLKGYQGNCRTCWKKSLRKLVTLAREDATQFDFFKQMEEEFSNWKRLPRENITYPIHFFREDKSVNDILKLTSDPRIEDAADDSSNINYQISVLHDGTELDINDGCSESCEVFT